MLGLPGSGKEEFVSIAKERGFSLVRMGDSVRIEAQIRGILDTDGNIGSFASLERNKHHPGIWAERTLNMMDDKPTLIDGVRSMAELTTFKRFLRDCIILVGIEVEPDIRFQRLTARGRSDAPSSWEEFLERDDREIGWGLAEAMNECDHTITNNSTLEEFQYLANELLDSLLNCE